MKFKREKTNILFFLGTYLMVIVLFFPAIFNFYSHDDFFHYRIAEANSLKEFISFFDLTNAPFGWGYYRPLTTQVLYFLGRTLFNFNPMIMHAVAFLMFFMVVFLVFKLIRALSKNNLAAYLGTFFYATSAAHFSHLYSIANQELGHAIFFLSSTLAFINFLEKKKLKYYFLSLLAFVIALTCKEFALMLPIVLALVYFYLTVRKEIKTSFKKFVLSMLPFGLVLSVYLYLHVFDYGLVKGDSYIWDFSPIKALNTLGWYGLWSLSLPKMLAGFDFISPGFGFNLSLFKSWPREVILVLFLFLIFSGLLLTSFIISLFNKLNRKEMILAGFSLIWFSSTLLPVLFLPWHKFTTYLTIPMIGTAAIIGFLLSKSHSRLLIFLTFAVYVSFSAISLEITRRVDWIGTGPRTAKKVYQYLIENYSDKEEKLIIVFFDTEEDKQLLLLPSNEVKLALSGDNFFAVFFPDKIRVKYGEEADPFEEDKVIRLPARQFVEF